MSGKYNGPPLVEPSEPCGWQIRSGEDLFLTNEEAYAMSFPENERRLVYAEPSKPELLSDAEVSSLAETWYTNVTALIRCVEAAVHRKIK